MLWSTYSHVIRELAGVERVDAAEAIRKARAESAVPRSYPHSNPQAQSRRKSLLIERADARTRTGDPFITSEVLYQLSYVGLGSQLSARNESPTVTIPPCSTLA
jgi:hypothetical protein